MVTTKRVNGPIYVTCPYCHAQYGPFQRVMLGSRSCSRCGRSFNLR